MTIRHMALWNLVYTTSTEFEPDPLAQAHSYCTCISEITRAAQDILWAEIICDSQSVYKNGALIYYHCELDYEPDQQALSICGL